MGQAAKATDVEQIVSFDKQGNVVVNKESSASNKLMARRAMKHT